MKLLAVFLLILSAAGDTFAQETDCNPDLPPCSDVHDIAKIDCVDGGPCTIAGDGDLGYLIDPEINSIDENLCSKKCKEQAEHEGTENKCIFYRWEDDRDHNSHCSLQTTCDVPDPWCDESNRHCSTGQIGCTDDGEPDPISCSLDEPVKYDKTKFHVVCLSLTDGEINIYDPSLIADIPPDTNCFTSRRCAAWDEANPEDDFYRKLAVTCDGSDGSWKAREDSGNAELSGKMISEPGKIVEQECTSIGNPCPDMKLTHTGQSGFSLICDNPLEENTLKYPNSCILLCDNHWTMAIECGMSEEGDKTWLDDWGEVVTDKDIQC